MKKFLLFAFAGLLAIASRAQSSGHLVLWYNQPAKNWNEALPIGNGRIGAMVFGGVQEELIQLNEATLWTGGPVDLNPNPNAPKYLQPVRDAVFRDSIGEAIALLKKIQGPDNEMYQPLGDIIIRQSLQGAITNYRRQLNIANAITSTTYTNNRVTYTRDVFVSAPDQIMMISITSSKPGALNFSIDVNHPLAYRKEVTANNELVLKGKARITNDENGNRKPFIYEDSAHCDGMRFQFRIKAITTRGTVQHTDSSLQVSNASHVVIYVSAATSFNGYDKCPDKDGKDEDKIARDYLQAALKKKYIPDNHIDDYRKYFERVSLSLTDQPPPAIPTDERLKLYKEGNADPALEELYFHFGRYLLISCSRMDGTAANLQGLWNKEIRPPWRSNYTVNINLQMNYWLASPAGLSELNLPLVGQIGAMWKNGQATARNYYNMNGWVAHHNSDIWGQTNPVGEGHGDPKWANWAMGSPWLCQHLYEYYRFTGDTSFLQKVALPVMKSAAQFCFDWLVMKDGYLITAPSTSPENVYIHPRGFKGTVTIASAMDMEIIWDLFTNIIEACEVLNTDKDFAAQVKQKRDQLSPLKIGKKGNLVEWYGDWEDEDPQHRHVSHLFGLHPGRQLSPLLDTQYANACRRTLQIRGDGGTGWSKAWKINFWARLLDGDHAYKMYQELLKHSTLNNLFDTHPPFQIDGNFGAAAGITEMLLQSHLKEIQLLPALPAAWKNGHVRGLIARGAFETEMYWKEGKLSKAFITSRKGNPCVLRTNEKITVKDVKFTVTTTQLNGVMQYITSFATSPGKKYELQVQ